MVKITRQQAKKQIGIFGIPLFIYMLSGLVVWYGSPFLDRYFPSLLFGFDADLITINLSALIGTIACLILFPIAARRLDLDLKDYMHDVDTDLFTQLAEVCIGSVILMISTVLFSFVYRLTHSYTADFTFIGHFTSPLNTVKNILYCAYFVFMKPVMDEYIFRAVINRLLGHYGRYFGVLASSLLYAIAQPSLSVSLPSLLFGWYLAVLTLKYHSIKPAIKVHMAVSLLTWLIEIMPGGLLIISIILIMCIYVIAALALFNHKANPFVPWTGAFEGKLWKILLTTPSIQSCLVLFVIGIILSYF